MDIMQIIALVNKETWIACLGVFMACVTMQSIFTYVRIKHQKVICPIDLALSRFESHGCSKCASVSEKCICPPQEEEQA